MSNLKDKQGEEEVKEAEPDARDFENAIGFYFALYQYWNKTAARLTEENERLKGEVEQLEISRNDGWKLVGIKHKKEKEHLSRIQELEQGIREAQKKYEMFVSNLEWHIRVNKPEEGSRELEKTEQRIRDYKDTAKDMSSLLSSKDKTE
jgi:archaellum component FlaC